MCMILQRYSRKKGKRAKKDLYCWKYFRRLNDKTIVTPVYNTYVREEKGYLLTPDVDIPEITVGRTDGGIVYGGVIHAARCDEEGLRFINENVSGTNPVVALMIIPKGYRYWVGYDGCICAERMEYVQTYKTEDGFDVGLAVDYFFADWYEEMEEWLIENETEY